MELLFWISIAVVFFTFLGYGLVLCLLVSVRRFVVGPRKVPATGEHLPSLTLIVAAYNEEDLIEEKVRNTLELDYPTDKLQLLFVTDGSTDATPNLLMKYQQIKTMHSPERRGKIHAIHRVMDEVQTEVVVFTDANTLLNGEALLKIARHYADPKVGAVAGEKRVAQEDVADATAGEGFYWKYESTLKRWDSELYSVVGAAGELFSVRRSLYRPVSNDTILDDFMISMLIAQQGYRIIYEPEAYATELSSENIEEELKRKVWIAAGGIQSVIWLKKLLNPFLNPVLTFQYVGHRVLHWTVAPFFMLLSLILNIGLVVGGVHFLCTILLSAQCIFYGAAWAGGILQKKKVKALFIPYYFCVMNYAVLAGIRCYALGEQSAAWAKARRKTI
jgi:cellulose synthase/poly-beta-1,6-N-acetylglucosamine synthase-like glycosyltransferase